MRIMAGDAPQRPVALREAGAGPHLFHLADGAQRPLVVRGTGSDEHAEHFIEPLAGPEIIQAPALTHNPCFPVEVALVADAFAPLRIEPGRIDD